MIVGYARTSTPQQLAGFEAQLKTLEEKGCEKIFSEQISSMGKRDEFAKAIEFVRSGDCLMVTSLDRLARSVKQLGEITTILDRKGVALRILNLNIDTATPTGKLLITLMGAIAQFERDIMFERQREGIIKARAEGKFTGRKPLAQSIRDQVEEYRNHRLPRGKLAKKLGISIASVYKILRETKKADSEAASNE